MNISVYIKELLYTHDCVILPSFGGFITNYKNAVIDAERSLFLPPSKELGFNSDLKHNDGLLISQYSKKHNCNYIEAKDIVTKFVQKIQIELNAKKTIDFPGVGSFKLNAGAKLLFTPDSNSNFLVDSFGLSSFQFPELGTYDVTKHIGGKNSLFLTTVLTNPFIRKSVIAITSAAIITSVIVFNPTLRNSIAHSFNFSGNSEIIADEYIAPVSDIEQNNNNLEIENVEAAVGLITNKRRALNPYTRYNIKDKSTNKTETKAEVIKEAVKEIAETNIKPVIIAKNKEIVKAETVEKQASSTEKFYIIAGSFGNKINASYLQKRFLDKGYNSIIMEKEKGLFRVAIDVKTDKESATKELIKLKSLYNTLSIWILTK